MPKPRFATTSALLNENPQKALEILGLGPDSRKTKTFLTDEEMALIVTEIRAKRRLVINNLRDAHARWHKRPVYEENEDGDEVLVGEEPEVLSDEEVIQRYTSAQFWHEFHQEFVDHMVSVQGYSIQAVSGLEDEDHERTPESTAGADRRHRSNRSSEKKTKHW